jgi:hypothetical protein
MQNHAAHSEVLTAGGAPHILEKKRAISAADHQPVYPFLVSQPLFKSNTGLEVRMLPALVCHAVRCFGAAATGLCRQIQRKIMDETQQASHSLEMNKPREAGATSEPTLVLSRRRICCMPDSRPQGTPGRAYIASIQCMIELPHSRDLRCPIQLLPSPCLVPPPSSETTSQQHIHPSYTLPVSLVTA